jgi:hypothetical protein
MSRVSPLIVKITSREHGWQAHENPAGNPPMRGKNPHLPLHAEAVPHHARQVVENLRQVAAGLALNQHRGDEEPGVEQRNPIREGPQRIGQWHAEVLLVVEDAKLGTDRIRHLSGDHFEASRECVTGPQRA